MSKTLQQLQDERTKNMSIEMQIAQSSMRSLFSLLRSQNHTIIELEQWKKEATEVMPDMQEIGRLIGVPLGQSVHDKIIPYLKSLQNGQ